MGPITLFDKSFLQMLSLDESVWFDHFFLANVSPLFYIETLADLHKETTNEQTGEKEVSVIADKFPERHGMPSLLHTRVCMAELSGNHIPMNGQILVANGRPVKVAGQSGMVIEEIPEALAFSRWQQQKFLEIERDFASQWRTMLASIDLEIIASLHRKIGIDSKSCKTLEQVNYYAENIAYSLDMPLERMHLALSYLGFREDTCRAIFERWHSMNRQPLVRYAPYVAYILKVELFFEIALAARLIGTERKSNRVDIAYLFYLPFSMVFVSSDKLHKRCVPFFLRNNQQFIWGPDFKAGLGEINTHYSKLSIEEKQKGMYSIADCPPKDGDLFISQIWDQHMPKWRETLRLKDFGENFKRDKLAEHMRKFSEAPTLRPDEVDFDMSNPDSLAIHRKIRRNKGSWIMTPEMFNSEE